MGRWWWSSGRSRGAVNVLSPFVSADSAHQGEPYASGRAGDRQDTMGNVDTSRTLWTHRFGSGVDLGHGALLNFGEKRARVTARVARGSGKCSNPMPLERGKQTEPLLRMARDHELARTLLLLGREKRWRIFLLLDRPLAVAGLARHLDVHDTKAAGDGCSQHAQVQRQSRSAGTAGLARIDSCWELGPEIYHG
jgi:hypothetical protein